MSELAEWLTKNRVRSFGPQTGIALVMVRDSLATALKANPPEGESLKVDVLAYYQALLRVCYVTLEHQGQIIAELAAAISGEGR